MKRLTLLTLTLILHITFGLTQGLEWLNHAGSSLDDLGTDIAVDNFGNVYITGSYQDTITFDIFWLPKFSTGDDIFVAKYDSSGNFIAAIQISGSGDDHPSGIVILPNGNVCIAGKSSSLNYPVTPTAYDITYSGGSFDGVVTIVDADLSTIVWSTYLGGADFDEITGVTSDNLGNVFLTGYSTSIDFPTTAGVYQPVKINGSGSQPIITKFNANLSTILFSTYLAASGTGIENKANAIAIDNSGNPYITGTCDATLPTTPGAFQTSYGGGATDIFVLKLNNTGSNVMYSTYIGSSGTDIANGIEVNDGGEVWVIGSTGSADFPVTAGAFQTVYSGGTSDIICAKLDNTGSILVISSFIGGAGTDVATDIMINNNEEIILVGFSGSTDFPVFNPGGGAYFQPVFNGGVFDMVLSHFSNGASGLIYSTYVGGTGRDQAKGIASHSDGNYFLTGFFDGVLNGNISYGGYDAVTLRLGSIDPQFVDTLEVWPGDANDDGITNIIDVLPIFIGYNATGPVRVGASLNWVGQPADSWNTYFGSIGGDYAHADCDGNGTIDMFDGLAILQNWSLMHNKMPYVNNATASDPVIYVDAPDTLIPGQSVSMPIYLGSSSLPANNVYAMTFTINYDPNSIVDGSVQLDFSNSWLGTIDVDMISISKDFYTSGKIEVGLGRIDQTNISGDGQIANLNIVMQADISGACYDVVFEVSDIHVIDRTEIEMAINTQVDTSMVYPDGAVGITMNLQVEPNLSIHMENSSHMLVYTLDGSEETNISILNSTGTIIHQESSGGGGINSIDTQKLSSGLYFIIAKGEYAFECKKFLVH